MLHALHDELDTVEALVSASDVAVQSIVQAKLADHLEAASAAGAEDIMQVFRDALWATAADIADGLAELTTQAVQLGAEAAVKRLQASRQ